MNRLVVPFLAALLTWACMPASAADPYPNKPVKLVVSYPAGSGLDTVARIVAQKLSELWKQPVLVENKGGGSGVIGAQQVVRSAPDGYTFLMAAPAEAVVLPILNEHLGYDPTKDLKPVSLIAVSPLVLVAHPSFPGNNIADLIALAKAKPGAIFYGASGAGSSHHLAGELLKIQAGIDIGVVNYPGLSQAINDVLGGQIPLAVSGFPPIRAQVKAGKLKVIAVFTDKRSELEPDWPSLGESGFKGYEVTTWIGMLAPAQLPQEIALQVSRDIARVVALPDVRERLIAIGAEVRGTTPQGFADFLKAEDSKYRQIIRSSNIKLN